ncbi:hypothetical protein ASG82_23825 [Mycobacterium sp. Soil538]|nr:hypothetical protein ASG82_23825 [Mycobacterium sp. Soil538]
MSEHPFAWWWALPGEQREDMNRLARESILELDGYPYSSAEVAAELVAWVRLEAEIMEAHGDWLEKVKRSIERTGREYNRETFLRYCELREHE